MNKGRKITIIVILVVTVFAIAYDAWVCLTYGSAATISWVTWTTARNYPAISFVVGFLCGHLFWVQQTGMKTPAQVAKAMMRPAERDLIVKITVNGRERIVARGRMSYGELVSLTDMAGNPSIMFESADCKIGGILVPGGSIMISGGERFNIANTGNA